MGSGKGKAKRANAARAGNSFVLEAGQVYEIDDVEHILLPTPGSMSDYLMRRLDTSEVVEVPSSVLWGDREPVRKEKIDPKQEAATANDLAEQKGKQAIANSKARLGEGWDLAPLSDTTRAALAKSTADLMSGLRDEAAKLQNGDVEFADLELTPSILPQRFAKDCTPDSINRFSETAKAVGERLVRYPDTYLDSIAEQRIAHVIIANSHPRQTGLEGEEVSAVSNDLDRVGFFSISEEQYKRAGTLFLNGLGNAEVSERLGVQNLNVQTLFVPLPGG